MPLGLLLLKDGVNVDEASLQTELVSMVRQNIGAFANFKRAVIVKRFGFSRRSRRYTARAFRRDLRTGRVVVRVRASRRR